MAVLTDQDIKSRLNKDFVIYPYDEAECLSPLGYDLKIGFYISLDASGSKLPENTSEKITIPPKTSLFIITKEFVWLSEYIVGTLHARGSLAAKGLFLNATTIDPNWSGQMTFLIFNSSDFPVELDKESRFVTMILHLVQTPTYNAPQTNPINVAKNHGKIYGENFASSLVSYITNNENQILRKNFETLIQKAKSPSPSKMLWVGIVSIFKSISLFLGSKFSNTIYGVAWVLTTLIIILALTLQWTWTWLQNIFGFTDPYSPTILMGQIAVAISALSILRSLVIKKE